MALMSLGSIAGLGGAHRLAGDAARRATTDGSSRSYLLVMRFAILNVTLGAFVTAAWLQGWLDRMIETDQFHIIKIIAVVFLIGLYQCGSRIVQLSRELNGLVRGFPQADSRAGQYLAAARELDGTSRTLLAGTLKLKLATRLGNVRYIANLLVMLGLVGTVVGFIVALSGVDPATVGDASAIGPMVSTMLLGMGMAMYKTLAGIACNIWLMLDYRLLEHGTTHLYARIIERGEGR